MSDRELAMLIRAALLAIVAGIEKKWAIKRNDIATAFVEIKPVENSGVARIGN